MIQKGRRARVLTAVVLVGAFVAYATSRTEKQEERLNVILIGIDSLRADHLGHLGYERNTSPAIDEVARQGVTFEQAISSTSWTLPSFMSIFTSLQDSVHGVQRFGQRLEIDHPLLPEVLQGSGYRTAGFYAGPYLHPAFGFHRGFDVYRNCGSFREIPSGDAAALRPTRFTAIDAMEGVTNPRLLEEASRWLEDEMEEPFFLFLHYWDVHFDYNPPPPYDSMFDPDYQRDFDFTHLEFNDAIRPGMDPRDLRHMVALYDGEIRCTDDSIRRLLGLLRKKGLLDRTLVVITADHGEEFFEHGKKGHQKSLYDEVLHVPLVMRLPGKVPTGVRVPGQVRTIDIYPTILELVGVDPPAPILGESLVSCWRDGEGSRPALSELDLDEPGPRKRSLRSPSGKLIRDLIGDISLFYDLEEDPGETCPLSPKLHPRGTEALTALERLEEILERSRDSLSPDPGADGVDLDPEVLSRLRSLGYVK